MKTVASAAVALIMAGTASAQSASGSDLTRMLNGTPPGAAPRAATPPATRPAVAAPAPAATRPAAPSTTTPRATPTATTPAPRPSATTPTAVTPPRATATPRGSTSAARSSATTSEPTAPTRTAPPATLDTPPGTTARPAATTPLATAPASPPPAPPTVLNATAVAALPFTVDLPGTFQITTGRPGPDFNVYAIRKGGRSFVTVYVGPSSQFPIYTGEAVQLSGRSSIVVPEDGRRRAVEHLFRVENPAQDIHAWVSSLEGADAAQAEQIAQSISPR